MTTVPVMPIPTDELAMIVAGEHRSPHGVLGAHPHAGGITVRALKPLAESVVVRWPGGEAALTHEHDGVWVGVLPLADVPDYRLAVTYAGEEHVVDDPYRFLPSIGELDLHLFNEGRHEELWRALGARIHRYDGPAGPVSGTSFTVWAPNARGVRLKGDFNSWDGREHPMRMLAESGVWEIFVPDVGTGAHYKFIILGADGQWSERADPMATYAEVPPATSSVVWESSYTWDDDAWQSARPRRQGVDQPMSIYEVHLGSWRRGLSYRDLAEELVGYVADLGFTHVELMPVMQHPYGGSWGYHVTGYFAPDSRFGNPDDFKYLVDRLHQAGIGVILDWVPGHFATDPWALARFDGTPLYEHPDPRRGWHAEWGSHIFDFGRREVRNFLYSNAVYWLEEFHADGLRVDGVASMLYLDYGRGHGEWLPNEHGGREHLEAVQFLQEMNATAYKRSPGIATIAEESTAWPGVTGPTDAGGLGFGFKWNMGWMHDTLDYLRHDPVHRAYHHHEMTFGLSYAWSENYVLPLSHDEVVHGKGSLLRKMPGDRWQQLANLRAYFGFMWAHPGKQLLFMGSEFAQESEWAESRELDWWLLEHPEHRGVQAVIRDLNALYRDTPALWSRDDEPESFAWLIADDTANNVYAFTRFASTGPDAEGSASPLVCIANFSPVPQHGYVLGLPAEGVWEEVLNTDADAYGGSGAGNLGSVRAEVGDSHGQPARASITIPPLATVWLRRAGAEVDPPEPEGAATVTA
ncbi:1,4-alpha-glucan branching protein GlgB [Nocardioides sp. BP30]|uniref:1,4-alpha-glucan branching protein GlgB n=1 Tax=Nocardioides sp. BP30 TaxID=3036374 RepID=UPI002468CD75|nr:1,4-alpha-glucan branching protein GlgB [Nocardioides sp. BP30]WGL51205.1 1,4-alpha-glucan branching protein GlgB [Nocardioides sp. BP30]